MIVMMTVITSLTALVISPYEQFYYDIYFDVQHTIILFLFSMIMKAGADYRLRSLLLSSDFIGYYRTIQNFGGRKFWRIWRISTESPKFSCPKFSPLKICN